MDPKSHYGRFAEHMHRWVVGLPDSEILLPLLKARLTPEEAEFLADFPFLPHTIEQLAERYRTPPTELMKRLDPLAAKGVVFRHESRDTIRYALNDSMFTFYRSPFWSGRADGETRRLAALGNRYFYNSYGKEVGGYPTMGLRAIPVRKTLQDPRRVLPYEDLLQVIEGEDFFCTSHCPCRQRKNLDPDSPDCEHETFNCLHFGRLARYMVRQGMGKEISKDEVLEALQAAADAGLVHGISNTRRGMDTICNCCSCCCIFLESVHVLGLNGHQPSNYIVMVHPETCKGCGLCEERCPMKALRLEYSPLAPNREGKAPVLGPQRCLGCGVCAHKCPTRSLVLVHREGEQDFPEDFREMAVRMGRERGRLLAPESRST